MGEKSGPAVFTDFTFCQNKVSRESLLASDIVVVSVQECSNSILKSFLFSDKTNWIYKLLSFFQSKFDLLIEKNLNALNMCVFVKKEISKKTRVSHSGEIYFGFYGLSPHKAVQYVVLHVFQLRLLICNLHLPCDRSNQKKRQKCMEVIKQQILMNERCTFDFAFLMGDFNFRSQINFDEFAETIRSRP